LRPVLALQPSPGAGRGARPAAMVGGICWATTEADTPSEGEALPALCGRMMEGGHVGTQAAGEVFGTPGMIKERVYEASNPVSEVAPFAPEVAEAAREGDPVASEIWADAAREVALTVTASLRGVFTEGDPVCVSWTGGLFEARDLMLEPFKRHVAGIWPSARLLAPRGTALDGGELLARSVSPAMFRSLVYVFRASIRGLEPRR
jgi:N-acetylglucosamine kinase-like BadF-type ATPase